MRRIVIFCKANEEFLVRGFSMRNFVLLALVATIGTAQLFGQQSGNAPAADAQDNAALLQKMRDLEDRVIALEGQLRVMKSQQAPPAQPAATEPAVAGAPAVAPAAEAVAPPA